MIKNSISGRLIKILAAAAVFVLFVILFKEDAHAASFTHQHTDSCYKSVQKTCKHKEKDTISYVTQYCPTCGADRGCILASYRESCPLGMTPERYLGSLVFCNTCGTVLSSQTVSAGSHTYQAKEIACGMDTSTSIAEVSLSAASTEPTNGNVTLNVSVSATSSEFALSESPYDFGVGFSASPSYEVSENGTYSATVMDSMGRTVTVSCTVECIDRELPVIDSVTKDTEEWSEAGVTLTVSAHDDKSGLHGEAYSINGGAFTSSASAKITANGNISVKVRDAAGNISETFIKVTNIGIDPKIVEEKRQEAERLAAQKAEQEKAEAERIAAENAAKEKTAKEKAAKEAKSQKTSVKTSVDKNSKKELSEKTAKAAAQTAEKTVNKMTGAIVASVTPREQEGKLIPVKNVAADISESLQKKFADEEIIESVGDLTGAVNELDSMTNRERVQGISVLKASAGGITVTVGVLLLLLGAFVISCFNYVYVMQGGKRRIICRCNVIKEDGRLTVCVPADRLKGHGKYLLFISPWKRGFKKKAPVSVKLEGKENLIPTDEGIAFKI